MQCSCDTKSSGPARAVVKRYDIAEVLMENVKYYVIITKVNKKC